MKSTLPVAEVVASSLLTVAPSLSTEMVTLQIYNETQKTWDTYQGTLDSECGLHGDWKYEIMGKELVLTGARLIGQVPEGE